MGPSTDIFLAHLVRADKGETVTVSVSVLTKFLKAHGALPDDFDGEPLETTKKRCAAGGAACPALAFKIPHAPPFSLDSRLGCRCAKGTASLELNGLEKR